MLDSRRELLRKHLLDNAKVGALEIVSGIYFLFDRGNIVYVGKSLDIFVRIRTHYRDEAKVFDRWAYLKCPAEGLDEMEREYIELFQPYLNKVLIPKVNYARRRPQERPEFIVHPAGFYDNIEVTDEDRRAIAETMNRILRGESEPELCT